MSGAGYMSTRMGMGIPANVADIVVQGGQQPVEECAGVNLHHVTVGSHWDSGIPGGINRDPTICGSGIPPSHRDVQRRDQGRVAV